MQLIVGLLLAPFLFYLPGWVTSQIFVNHRDALDRHYERFLVSTLWTGWLALLLAELAIFSLFTLIVCTLLVFGLLWLILRRRVMPVVLPKLERPRWELWVYLVMLGLFALFVARPFEMVTGGRDPGVYVNTGYAIVQHGAIVQTDPLLAQVAKDRTNPDLAISEPAKQAYTNLYGGLHPERYISTRYTQPSFFTNETGALEGKIYPNNFHLYPAWIAVWMALFGLRGGLLATGFLGWLAVWSIAMLGRRLVAGVRGSYLGIYTLLFLGLNTLQIWFSRYANAEIYAQLTLWAGLAMWANYAKLPQINSNDQPEQTTARLKLWYGLLTGIAIGQIILSRLEFLNGVVPLMLFLFVQALRRRWTRGETWIALGFSAMTLHGLIHIATIARFYFANNTWGKFQDYTIISRIAHPFYSPLLQDIRSNNFKGHTILLNTTRFWIELAIVLIVLGVLLLLWRKQGFLQRVEQIITRYQRWLLAGLVGLLLGLSFFAYFIRPQHLSVDAVVHPIKNMATWESYIGAPLEIPVNAQGKRTQREIVLGNMVRLGWYFSPLGIALAVLGLAHWLWRGLDRASWLVLLTGIAYSAFPINDTYGTNEQVYIYIARRFIPGAIPMFSLGMAWAITMLIVARKRWLRAIGGLCAVAMLAFFVATGWRSVKHIEYAGALDSIAQLATRFEPNAIVIMRGGDRDTPTNIATPLKYTFGVETLVAYNTQTALQYRDFLAAQVRNWQNQGRPVYLMLGANGGSFNLPTFDYQDQGLFDLQLPEWQQLQSQKPYTTSSVRFTYRIYKLSPTTAPVSMTQLGLTDYAYQVYGFYSVEQLPDQTNYAWLRERATFLMPSNPQARTLSIKLGLGTLPPSLQNKPMPVCLQLTSLDQTSMQQLGCQAVNQTQLSEYTWNIPALNQDMLLEIVPERTWTPNNYVQEYATPPNDGRILSIQWGGAILK